MSTIRRAIFSLILAALLLTSGAALAQPSTEVTALDECITACAGRFRQCVPGTDFDLARVCAGIDKCKDLTEGAAKAANQICALCAQGQMNCVTGGNGGSGTASGKGGSKSAKSDPAEACAEANGVLVDSYEQGAPPVCLTPKYAYDQAMALRGEHAEMLRLLKAQNGGSQLSDLDQKKLTKLLARYDQLVKGLERIGKLESDVALLRTDVDRLRQDFDRYKDGNAGQDSQRAARAFGGRVPLTPEPVTTVVAPGYQVSKPDSKAQTGLTIGAYGSSFAYRHFGRLAWSAGVESELVLHMFDDASNRFVVGGGGGYGGKFYDEYDDSLHLIQLHVNAGIRYGFDGYSITPGIMGLARYTSSDWNAVFSWGGVYLETGFLVPNTEDEDQVLKFFVRPGIGIRHAQHPIELEGFEDRAGVLLSVGLKWESVPQL